MAGGETEIWDGGAPLEVRLYAPIRLGFRLDLGAYLGALDDPEALEARISEIEAALNAALPAFAWFGPEPLASGPTTIGHNLGRAPSKRPAFFLSSDWREQAPLNDITADERAALALGPLRLRFTMQDFGIAIAEIRGDFVGRPDVANPLAYAARLNDLTTVCTEWLAGYCGRMIERLEAVFEADGLFHRPPFAAGVGEAAGAADAPVVYWMHALTVLEAGDRPLLDDAWRSTLRETGEYPLRGHPIDAIIRLRAGGLVSLPTRDMDVALMIGWGCSFAVIEARRSLAGMDEAAPTEFVLHLSQAFNAALFDLNRAVLSETAALVSKGAEASQDLRRLIEVLDLFQEEMNLLTSLLSEQRFCLPAVEQRVWDTSLSVWGTERLIADLGQSLSLLRAAVERRQRDRDERRGRRITVAVTVITISSAAALIYDMIPNVLEAETPSRVILVIQMGILAAFMVMAWTLVRDVRRARRARRRNLQP
ncbi:MAG: hypothetical protein ACK4FG_07795 [Brevundimonas sp.]